jgi:hypothetical protein
MLFNDILVSIQSGLFETKWRWNLVGTIAAGPSIKKCALPREPEAERKNPSICEPEQGGHDTTPPLRAHKLV